MNKWEFLSRLEELLYDLPEEERVSALEYYQDYFEEAGPDMEFQVVHDLGSPERIAAIIKTNLIREVENRNTDGEFTEHGYSAPEFDEKQNFVIVGNEIIFEDNDNNEKEKNHQTDIPNEAFTKETRRGAYYGKQDREAFYDQKKNDNGKIVPRDTKKWTGKKIALLVLFLLIGFPIIFGLALSAVGTAFGLVMGVIGCLLALLFAGFILVLTGVILLGVGVIKLFTIPIVGIYLAGAGFVCFGIGLILSWLTIKFWKKGVPFVIAFFRNLFHKKTVEQ